MYTYHPVLQTVRKNSPLLYAIVMIHLIGAVVCIAGLFIDDRTLMGINVWVKPLKFCISGAIYILTVGYLINFFPYSTRKKHVLRNIVSITLFVEIGIIVYQAFRGVKSHYNQDSAFDGILFALMGLLIGINVLLMVLFAFDSLRLKMNTPRAVQWGIFFGWLIVIGGSWVGGQMIGQMAHNVGIADGGEGLPILNWSTVAGDLRVAHFFGLHAIQIIPLFALGLVKWKVPKTGQYISVVLFALAYGSFIGYTFWQAKQAMPFLSF